MDRMYKFVDLTMPYEIICEEMSVMSFRVQFIGMMTDEEV
jgi:hypothetical protein